jgi:hypothetical protein
MGSALVRGRLPVVSEDYDSDPLALRGLLFLAVRLALVLKHRYQNYKSIKINKYY